MNVLLRTVGLCLALSPALLADELPAVLTEGRPLLPMDAEWKLSAPTGVSTVVSYERPAAAAGVILQAKTTNMLPQKEAWQTYARTRFPDALATDDVLLLTGRVRALESTNANGRATLRINVQINEPPYLNVLTTNCWAGKEWRRFWIPFRPRLEVPQGKGALIFNFGYAIQTLEVCEAQLHKFPPGFDTTRLPRQEEP